MNGKLLQDLFVLTLPLAEKIVRPIVVYVFLLVALRLAGKRGLVQLNAFDLVVLLTISNTVQNAIIGEDNTVTGGLIGATTLLVVNHIVVRYAYGHDRFDRLIEGDADVLISDGVVRKERLDRELITRAELEAAAHRQGFASLDDIDRCTLESGGSLSFVAKRPEPDAARHAEILAKLEELSSEVAALRASHG